MVVNITKPTVGGATGSWGTTLNTALDAIVSETNRVATALDSGAFAPLPAATRNPLTGWFHVDGYGAKLDGTTTDTAAVNAALAACLAAGGGTVYVPSIASKVLLIDAALVIGSNTRLAVAPDVTVRLKAGSGGNMLANSAISSARSVIDGTIAGGSLSTLTSATATFTSGDTGKTVTVVGAGVGGTRLVTTITYVNATTVTLGTAATAAVSNAWTTIGTRDQNITVEGGIWDRAANGASGTSGGSQGYLGNTMRFRRVDNLKVRDVRGTGTAGKYFVNPGDVWKFEVSRMSIGPSASDGCHVNGPARHGVIRDSHGYQAGDDVVSLTGNDFGTSSGANLNDTFGDIEDVLVDGVVLEYGSVRAVLVLAGSSGATAMNIRNVTVRNVRGKGAGGTVWVGGDPTDPNTLGGTYTTVLVDTVRSLYGGSGNGTLANGAATVFFYDGTHDDITVRAVTADPLGDAAPIAVGGSQTCTMGRLRCSNIAWSGGTSPNGAVNVAKGSIEHLIVSDSQLRNQGTGGASLVRVITGSSASIGRLSIHDVHVEAPSGGSTVAIVAAQDSGTTNLPVVEMTNVSTKNVTYPLGRYGGTTLVKASNVHMEGAAALIRVEATGVVSTELSHVDSNNAAGVSIAAGGSLRSLTLGLRTDASTTGLAKNTNDLMTNTNAALACGAGPIGYNGTAWKHLITGATY